MSGWRLVCLLLASAAGTDLETIDFLISRSPAGIAAMWDCDESCVEEVAVTAAYKKLGAPDSELQECALTEECSCEIPTDSLDRRHNYTLVVNATIPHGGRLSTSKDFDPNREAAPPPGFQVRTSDALVTVNIPTSDYLFKNYYLRLRRNDSTEKQCADVRGRLYIIPPSDLLPERTYCLRLQEANTLTMEATPASAEQCFTAPAAAPPHNLRMAALDTTYLLSWDWDSDRAPNATFSVEKCLKNDGCAKIKGCENITAPRCNCSGLRFVGSYILRASVYDRDRDERSSSVIQFDPSEETIFGPPKDLAMRIVGNGLFINVSAPDVFSTRDVEYYCRWLNHLAFWTNSTPASEVTVQEDSQPFFHIQPLEVSTTYCAKAKLKCESSGRSSLYSEVRCITTDPTSYLVAWIAICAFLGIVGISVILYVCFCPLQRCIKLTFFPSSKLPSSIEKGFGESPLDCFEQPFLMLEEETTDLCFIVHNSKSEDLVQINHKNASQASSQNPGNYSNVGQTTEESVPVPQ